VGHLVDADRHRQDHDIILTRFDFYTISIPNPEPFLGNFSNLVAAFSNSILVTEDIAFDIQVGGQIFSIK